MSGTGTAGEDEGESDEVDLVVEDGQLNYTGTDSVSTLSESPDADRRSIGNGEYVEVNEAAIQQAVQAFNQAADNGEVEIYEEDGEAYIEPTDETMDALEEDSDTVDESDTSTMCGQNDFETEITWKGGVREILWMDDTLTRRIRNRMGATGITAGTLAGIAAGSIVGVKASALVALFAALLVVGAYLLTENNQGCGVKITFYPASFAAGPGGVILAGLYIDPQ
ncbi:hypothetical protein [Natronobeatus ordinarius]|uniref:hypothetical protein n=1 Tax=Natronobeatus ordinarius TaxID=2963433 RepID=UPI0020CEEDED|nr:hypothetical protein [Natronobeatus ordinarius]